MLRLSTKLKDIVQQRGKALVAYLVAGDPAPTDTVSIMHEIAKAGADVIELGVPFSDPEAEGPVIQRAHERALKHHVTLSDCMDMVAEFRKNDTETAIVLMGYLNPIEIMGYATFAKRAGEAGVNGTIIVNLPPEEAEDFADVFAENNIEPVYLLSPTTTDERAAMVCAASRGFVYYVSLKGPTGSATLDVDDVAEKMGRFRAISDLPVMVGFGIRDAVTAKAVTGVSDGAVVGTAIVKLMEEHGSDLALLKREVSEFVSGLRVAVDEHSVDEKSA